MNNLPTAKRDGQAVTVKKLFSRETSISLNIQAPPTIVWALLTNASDFSRWNSTIVSVEGDIKAGHKIRLKSTLDEKRTFNLKVKDFEPEKRLRWGDNMGNRVYTLQKEEEDTTRFTMTEKIGGSIFPLFARFIPPFDESFEQFAADLKKEAETIHNSNN
jgi:uncharacterized protein YndB with AHSA1/START domain